MNIIKIDKLTNPVNVLFDGVLPESNREKYELLISDNFKHYFPEWMIEYIDDVKKGDFNMSLLEDDSYKDFFEYMEDEWLLETLTILDILNELTNDLFTYKIK